MFYCYGLLQMQNIVCSRSIWTFKIHLQNEDENFGVERVKKFFVSINKETMVCSSLYVKN